MLYVIRILGISDGRELTPAESIQKDELCSLRLLIPISELFAKLIAYSSLIDACIGTQVYVSN